MSLYIGNLSSRTRRDELERVFQRFGGCNVRLKDGYGFVVYDFPPNAEKALKALQKRYICGEPLTLTWSNKQPKPFKRFARTERSYHCEPRRGGDYVWGADNVKRKLGSNDRQDYRMSIKQPDGNSRRHSSADMLDEDRASHQDNINGYVGEEYHGHAEDFLDEGGRAEPDPVGNDRWGEQFFDPTNEIGVENKREYDRYEPYEGFDRKNDDENCPIGHSGGSPARRRSQENIRRDHISEVSPDQPNDAKFRETCYKCGGSGHKMGNCPQRNASQRKFARFDHWHGDDISRRGRGEVDLERFGSRSQEKQRSSKDTIRTRGIKTDAKSSGSRKHQRSGRGGSSPVARETDKSRRKDNAGKKRSRKAMGSPQRHSIKRARRPVSSPFHSDYNTFRSHSTSQSSKHVQRSHFHSRSRSFSSRALSMSSDSRSNSISHYCRPKSFKSRSRSSSPTSLSLSVSLGQPLPSSSNKAQLNLRGSSDNATTPESKEILIEQGQPGGPDILLKDAKLDNSMVILNNENSVLSPKAEIEMENDQPLLDDNDDHQRAFSSLYEVTNLSTPLVEKGTLVAGSASSESLKGTKDNPKSDALMMEHVQIPIKKPYPEAPVCSYVGRSTNISAEELCMVLTHYGLGFEDENERHLPADAYFGCARLWPWEIIYYRRLKKGPISVENYARRVDQNREFGIVDKYIRSSSGWGELDQENI